MSPTDKKGSKPRKPRKAPVRGRTSKPKGSTTEDFLAAFEKLLRSKKVPVPKGLADAPPEAYASQPASFVEHLERLPKANLKTFADKVAGYAGRQAARAKAEWEGSPLIAELRRRGLDEPPCPSRVTGVSVSLAKPLAEWSDRELIRAATEWSRRGSAI